MCFHYSTHTSQLMSSMHRLFYISVICINVLYSVSSYPVATMKLCIKTESIFINILCFMLMYVCFIMFIVIMKKIIIKHLFYYHTK